MKALSVRAPWWWWILYGGKDIENRSRRTHYRGPIMIHASSWWSAPGVAQDNEAALEIFEHNPVFKCAPGITFDSVRALGGHIVGVADIVDCLEPPADFPIQPGQVWNVPGGPWHMPGQYGWKLENIRPVINPTAIKGKLGLFETDYTVTHAENKVVRI